MDSEKNKSGGDIMITDPICIQPEATIYEALNVLKKSRFGCLPVEKTINWQGLFLKILF